MTSGPRPDLPFAPEVLSYVARRMQACGLQPDRAWLSAQATGFDMILLDSHATMLAAARNAIPQSHAQWELSAFYECAMPPAVFDLCNGPLTRFAEFAFLYERLLGAAARPWLPSLFLAAAATPGLDEKRRIRLVSGFNVDDLRDAVAVD